MSTTQLLQRVLYISCRYSFISSENFTLDSFCVQSFIFSCLMGQKDPIANCLTYCLMEKDQSLLNSFGSSCHLCYDRIRFHSDRCRRYGVVMLLKIAAGVNTLMPRQNGRHFADDIFKLIFLNENVWIPIKISLKFVPQGLINNIPALVQIMAWRQPGAKAIIWTNDG